MDFSLAEDLRRALPQLKLLTDEPLSRHTTFRIGGAAALMAFPSTAEVLSACLRHFASHGETPRILGAGSNILAPDEGLNEPVICLRELAAIRRVGDTHVEAEAGALLSRTAVFAKDAGLTGLEFAHGIPGTVGGAVYMNAGAYGGEICAVCDAVTVMSVTGDMREIAVDGGTFGYRTSRFEGTDDIIVSARFALSAGNPDAIGAQMAALAEKRRASQPLELPSAGSTFKRPAGGYAAALIDQAGLKGRAVGGAEVSRKHAGFVVNRGGATAADVRELMKIIQDTVEKESGIRLEPEVRIW
ncbi:MAG: UDP-N-acetylmuramate dehydrogenase [Oscillospiraceae bacterium]|nr:UDP-N-acetylmuramate dehydrogenase [Oscillospiraceae bacterium]